MVAFHSRLSRALRRRNLPHLPQNQARLLCVAGADAGATYRVDRPVSVIGREPRAAIRLTSADVSRRHAVLRHHDGALVLEDLGSRNGTRINGTLATLHVLAAGDHILLGSTLLLYLPGRGPELRILSI